MIGGFLASLSVNVLRKVLSRDVQKTGRLGVRAPDGPDHNIPAEEFAMAMERNSKHLRQKQIHNKRHKRSKIRCSEEKRGAAFPNRP